MATTDAPRAEYAGPESGPETPFPIKLRGPVIKGFGRGSKEVCTLFVLSPSLVPGPDTGRAKTCPPFR